MSDASATSAARFLPRSAEICPAAGFGVLHHVTSTGSTNTDLADGARDGDTQPKVLVADHQSAGRGRLDRRWESDPGRALLVSLRIDARAEEAGAEVRALGAAARAALTERLDPSVEIGVKWPNDVLAQQGPAPGKLAGVLAEFVTSTPSCVVIGIGINLLAYDGPAGASGSSSVVECGGDPDRDALLASLLEHYADLRTDPARVLAQWRAHSATLGRRVRAELPGGASIDGTATALLDDGSIVVTDDAGAAHELAVGDIVHAHTG